MNRGKRSGAFSWLPFPVDLGCPPSLAPEIQQWLVVDGCPQVPRNIVRLLECHLRSGRQCRLLLPAAAAHGGATGRERRESVNTHRHRQKARLNKTANWAPA